MNHRERRSSERRTGGRAGPVDPTLDVTEASNVLPTSEAAAIPTFDDAAAAHSSR
jgi:hypothetical protein